MRHGGRKVDLLTLISDLLIENTSAYTYNMVYVHVVVDLSSVFLFQNYRRAPGILMTGLRASRKLLCELFSVQINV